MNPQPRKITSINKFNPLKAHVRHQSINLPLGTPTQSKRPLNKENILDKSPSPSNISSVSARGVKNINFKSSNTNFARNEEHKGGVILDANNSFKYNSGLKKFEIPNNNQTDRNLGNNKSNTNLNLLGTIKIKPNTGQRISTNRSKPKIGFNLNSSLTQSSFNNTMTNMNKNASNRSITPTNMSKRTSKDFLNRSLNMKNQNNGNRFSETNASFSGSINNLNKTGGFSKSPSVYKDIENKPKTSIRVSKDASLDRNLSANKSFDKSKEGFNPKSTLRIVNNKSPMSSRSNIKKLGNNVSISTNASPIFKNAKNISITNTTKGSIDNSVIKNFNDFKNKNASPVVYSSFIKKIQKNGTTTNNKKIPTPNQMQQNVFGNNINNNNATSYNMNNNNSPGWNNMNNNPIKKNNNPSNMNSNDLSTNNTSGLNSNNNPNFNLGNGKNSNGNTITNDADFFFQIQPKYEDENKNNRNNNLSNQKVNQPLNNYNNGFQQQNNPNQNGPLKNRENKFLNNNNTQNIDFKTMNTSPLLRKKNETKKPNEENNQNNMFNKQMNNQGIGLNNNNMNQMQKMPAYSPMQNPGFNVIQQNNIANQYNINQQIINPGINFPNNLLNNIPNPINDFNQLNITGISPMSVPSSGRNSFNNNQYLNNLGLNNSNVNENSNRPLQKTIKNIHEFTKVGYSGPGVKKVNQDNFFVYRNFNGSPNNIFMSVCDGHGMLGHEVSGYLRENLPVNLNNQLKLKNKNVNIHNVNSILTDTFIETNNKLLSGEVVDTTFSGSTCVSLIYTPEKIISANVGDSRAVLGKFVNGEWKSHDLTRDHKPSDTDEAARIKRRGGRIEPFRDEDDQFIGPPRVWLKDDDVPGLAMSRSFGDRVAASVGVIAEPEIFEYKFTEDDKFFILASDGVWEFIESPECVDIIKEFYMKNDIVGCCEYLHKESSTRWTKEEEVIDDITMIVVFLD